MDCSTPGSLSFTDSQNLLKLMSIESMMPSSHLILYRPLLLPPSIFPSIRVFSNESVLVWPQVNNREGKSPSHQQKIGLKIYWAWPRPSEQDPVSPWSSPIRKLPWASYPSPSEGRQNENHNHRKLTNLITRTTQPCLTQWNYEPCRVRPPKTDGSWWRVLTKHGPLEKGMANHFSILALRTP